MKKILLYIAFCLFFTNGFAQNFKWVKGFGSKLDNDWITCIKAEEDLGSTILLHRFYSQTTTADTMLFDSISFPNKPPLKQYGSYFARLDSNGNAKKAVFLGTFDAQSFCKDDSGNYYIIAALYDTFSFNVGGNLYTSQKDGSILFLKYDQNFNLIWHALDNKNGGTGAPHEIIYAEGKILFSTRVSGSKVNLGGKTFNINSFTLAFGEISKYNGRVLWANVLPDWFQLYGMQTLKNKIYLTGIFYDPTINGLKINTDSFSVRNGFIIKCDSVGNYIRGISLHNKNYNQFTTITTDGKNLYVGGLFNDTLLWGNKKVIPQKLGPYNNFQQSEMFMASISEDLVPGWIFTPRQVSNSGGSGYIYKSKYIDKFIYWTGRLGTAININGDIYNDPGIVLKSDLIGNVVWATCGGTSQALGYSIDAIPEKTVYLAGAFSGKIIFGNKSDSTRGETDAFVLRISDNAIIRGDVNSGPYCAGDSILIPFTKIGGFDTSNVFYAELSDENGEFIGGERKLGQIKSNKDSFVIGKIPDFKVASSGKYRIRILSTAPAVQSYYKVDSLRLLIYSRDKANPGKDTTICKGDTITLSTFGGTKWTWSPKFKMKDSSSRETAIWPDKTTTYKIIISDSSGCGEADTAFKTITVRKDIEITFKTPKDTVCKNASIQSIVNFKEGDSTSYSWFWVLVKQDGSQVTLKTASNKNADTISYTLTNDITDSLRLFIFVKDGCSNKNFVKSASVYIKKSKSNVTFTQKDTALCPGTSTPIIANFKGSDASLLNWKWQEKNQFNQWLQKQTGSKKQSDTMNYNLPSNWKGVKQIRTILTDNCSGLNDTAIYNITPRDTLKLTLNTGDTTLCKGQSHTYKAKGKDGYTAGYQFTWIDTNTGDTLSKADSLVLTTKSTQQIKVTLADGCMPNSISRAINIQVHPALQASMNANDTSLCFGQNLNLQATALGGKGTGYNFKWILDNTSIGINDTLQFNSKNYFTNAGTKTLYLILNDGCTKPADTNQINITVFAPLKVTSNKKDSVCFGNSFSIKANATGGKGIYSYQWLDENNVLQGNTDSLILINKSSTQTQITRKVIVSDGCSKNDTSTVQTVFLAPLKLTVNTSDSCPTSTTLLTAKSSGGKTGQHQITWFNGSTQIGTGASITVNPNGLTQTYTAILKDNCSIVNDTARITIGSKPSVKLLVDGQCLGDETSILAKKINTSNALNYAWEIDNVQALETDSMIKRTFPNLGTYKVKVSVSAGATCKGADSTNITIIAKPIAAFQYVHFQSIGNSIPFKFINQSQNSTNWLWTFGNGDTSQHRSPDYTYNDTGRTTVILIASNQGKCFDTTQQTLPIYDKIEFYFPNVFSPNGNNTNEGFGLHPGQAQFVTEFSLQVFNRWGELVYKSNDPSQQWSSTKYQQGVYIWKAEIRDVYNVLHELEGVVEVLK